MRRVARAPLSRGVALPLRWLGSAGPAFKSTDPGDAPAGATSRPNVAAEVESLMADIKANPAAAATEVPSSERRKPSRFTSADARDPRRQGYGRYTEWRSGRGHREANHRRRDADRRQPSRHDEPAAAGAGDASPVAASPDASDRPRRASSDQGGGDDSRDRGDRSRRDGRADARSAGWRNGGRDERHSSRHGDSRHGDRYDNRSWRDDGRRQRDDGSGGSPRDAASSRSSPVRPVTAAPTATAITATPSASAPMGPPMTPTSTATPAAAEASAYARPSRPPPAAAVEEEVPPWELPDPVDDGPPTAAVLRAEIAGLQRTVERLMGELVALDRDDPVTGATSPSSLLRNLRSALAPEPADRVSQEAAMAKGAGEADTLSGVEPIDELQPMRPFEPEEVARLAVIPAARLQFRHRHVAMATVVGAVRAPVTVCRDGENGDFALVQLEANLPLPNDAGDLADDGAAPVDAVAVRLEVRAYDAHLRAFAVQHFRPGYLVHCLGHLLPLPSRRGGGLVVALTDPGCTAAIVHGEKNAAGTPATAAPCVAQATEPSAEPVAAVQPAPVVPATDADASPDGTDDLAGREDVPLDSFPTPAASDSFEV